MNKKEKRKNLNNVLLGSLLFVFSLISFFSLENIENTILVGISLTLGVITGLLLIKTAYEDEDNRKWKKKILRN